MCTQGSRSGEDLYGGGVGPAAEFLVVEVEVGFPHPHPVHHHLVPRVDLQPVLREVQEVPACTATTTITECTSCIHTCILLLHVVASPTWADGPAHDVVDLHAGRNVRTVKKKLCVG